MGLRTGAGWCLHILLSRSANILGFAGHQSLPFDRRLAPDQLRRLCRAYSLPAASSAAGLPAQPGTDWDASKLRFVAGGTVFFIAFGLAMAAQFALRKGPRKANPVLTPQMS